MSNMSYCRYRNTLSDLLDCQEYMGEPVSSIEEREARKKLLFICQEIVDDWDEDMLPGVGDSDE